MSQVLLLTADSPLPLCNKQVERTKTVTVPMNVDSDIRGKTFSITAPAGFQVQEHGYYRHAVEELGHTMKPYQYELDLEVNETDLADLRQYLQENLAPGEEAEFWNLWVGPDALGRPVHYRGPLSSFGLDTLEQFLDPPHPNGGIGQCRMTVVI